MAPLVRSIQRHERGRVLDLLHEWISREFFGRYFEHDPAFRDDLCLVAEDEGRFVSTLQIIPKTVLIDGHELRVGGIGNVFTTEDYRHQGVASQVLRRAGEVMQREGFDLSLLFASRLTFYGQFGWSSHRRLLGAVTPPESPYPAHGEGALSPAPAPRLFDRARDLPAVMDVYESYCDGRNGCVVRDRRYWEGQLRYAGTPDETFLLAERRGRVVAYARLVDLYGVYNVMEHAALPGANDALVDLLAAAAERGRERGFVLMHLGADPGLADALGARGCAVREVEDVFWMWRVMAPAALAAKLGIATADVESPAFLERVFPLRGSVYWTADRF